MRKLRTLNHSLKIVSLHTNTWGCGIAKYNFELAKILKADVISVESWFNSEIKNIILSVGLSEFNEKEFLELENHIFRNSSSYILVLHSLNSGINSEKLLNSARKIIVLNSELQNILDEFGFSTEISYTPSLLPKFQQINKTNEDFNLFTFGMGHKHEFNEINVLLTKLRNWGKKPRINLSSAIHIGSQPLDSLNSEIELLSDLLKVPINFLGFLSDEALLVEMNNSELVFRFFESGIRSNNTTAMTALQNGIPFVTNTDKFSPKWLKHNYNFLDIKELAKEPNEPEWSRIGINGQTSYLENADWPGTATFIKQVADTYLI